MDLKGTAAGGYSVFQIGTSAKFKIVRVHQWSYEHFVGPIPQGDARLSQMRLPTPEHPLPGTAKDNAVDAARKGRNGAPKKLTPE